MIPEERAAALVASVSDATTTDDLQQMIADAIRDAVKDDREKAGRTYHPKPGERRRINCHCGGKKGCDLCGGQGWFMTKYGGEAMSPIRRTGKEIPTADEVLALHEVTPAPPVVAAVTEIEARAREYCASLFDDLAAQLSDGKLFGKLDDDEYSRRVVSSTLGGYAHHVRTYFLVKAHARDTGDLLKPLFQVPYATRLEVFRALTVEFDDQREFEYKLATEMGEEIADRIAEDDVLEHLAEAVGARMVQIFYRGIERRLDDLKERGVPVDEEMVRRASG